MSDSTPNLNLPLIQASQAQKHVTHNEALALVDALTQLSVVSRTDSQPPETPQNGERYIVAAGASGVWLAHDNEVAVYHDGVWTFVPPQPGWLAWVRAESLLCVYVSGGWFDLNSVLGTISGAIEINQLGVNTSSDMSNKLAVKSDSVLFSHDDVTPGSGDVRLTLNKSAPSATASVTLTEAYSGRAEIGLSGNNDLAVKVTADGSNWTPALVIENASGIVQLPNGFTRNGLSLSTLTAAQTAQHNLSGPSHLTLNSNYDLSWSGRFLLISAGRGDHFASDGLFDIRLPAVGTVIPGYGGSAGATVTSDGIRLNSTDALYYVLPIGENHLSQDSNFRMVSWTTSFKLPPDEVWVFVAQRNVDSGEVRLGNGETIYPSSLELDRTVSARSTDYKAVFHSFNINSYSDNSVFVFENTSINRGLCYSTSTGEFIANQNGAYYFYAGLLGASVGNSAIYSAKFIKNGNTLNSGRSVYNTNIEGYYQQMCMNIIIELSKNDKIAVMNLGGDFYTGPDLNYLGGYLIS